MDHAEGAAEGVRGRVSRLVRAAVENKKTTLDRAAEILGV
jgi:hypothetical protein